MKEHVLVHFVINMTYKTSTMLRLYVDILITSERNTLSHIKYNRLSMIKYIELMNTPNSKERFRIMLFLKIVFKLYAETLKK